MKKIFLAAVLAGATAGLQGCGDSTGSEDDSVSGSLAFSYAGARSGSYSATGAFRRQTVGTFVKQPFAAGVELQDPVAGAVIGIVAYSPVTTTTGHQVIFLLPPVTAGQTLNLDGSCADPDFCPVGLVSFDLNPDLAVDDSEGYLFTTGTLHVTSATDGHVTGTFSGTAEDVTGAFILTVTNGTFDVPVLSESQFLGNRMATAPTFEPLRSRMRQPAP
jgi:hypothetical protein